LTKLVWSENAFRALSRIEEYLSEFNINASQKVVNRLINRAEVLTEHPQIGRIVPELGVENIRELIEGNYRIVYRITKEGIQILTVFHYRRLLSKKDISNPEINSSF